VTEQAQAASERAARLQAIWYAASRPPLALRLLSRMFGAVVALRAMAHRSGLLAATHAAAPVIVVGNLTVGGTGKTPLVIWLVQQLRALGRRPGIVLRGYGGTLTRGGSPQLVTDDSDPAAVGDEAVLLRLRTQVPVVAYPDRVRATQRLLREGVDIIVCDDGLQHLRLARDFEIVVIDGARGVGNGYLLPAGPLREPVSRLARADCVVFNGEYESSRTPPQLPPLPQALTMQLRGDRLMPLTGPGPDQPLAQLAGRAVHAVAGIGNPARFFRLLTAAGLRVIEHVFPDHHRFGPQDLSFGDDLPVLMTEKDAVKCRRFAAADRWYLPVTVDFSGEQAATLLKRLGVLLKE
jgi:tetraacyldisaccharide 4'-kinase